MAVPAVRRRTTPPTSGSRRNSRRSRCCDRARQRSSRPARSASSTTSSTGLTSRRHPGPCRQLGVGPAARAGGLPQYHRRAPSPCLSASSTDHPSAPERRISAWSILVGHTTCSDPLWRAAKALADEHRRRDELPHVAGAGSTPTGFIAEFGQRPMIHLDEIGVLGPNVAMTHCVHVDDHETRRDGRSARSASPTARPPR